MHRAGVGAALNGGFLLVCVVAIRHVEDNGNLANATGIGIHVFGNAYLGSRKVHVVLFCVNPHNGHTAGGKACCTQVGGGKGGTFAWVVGICDNGRSTGNMGTFYSQITKVFCCQIGHVMLLACQAEIAGTRVSMVVLFHALKVSQLAEL